MAAVLEKSAHGRGECFEGRGRSQSGNPGGAGNPGGSPLPLQSLLIAADSRFVKTQIRSRHSSASSPSATLLLIEGHADAPGVRRTRLSRALRSSLRSRPFLGFSERPGSCLLTASHPRWPEQLSVPPDRPAPLRMPASVLLAQGHLPAAAPSLRLRPRRVLFLGYGSPGTPHPCCPQCSFPALSRLQGSTKWCHNPLPACLLPTADPLPWKCSCIVET